MNPTFSLGNGPLWDVIGWTMLHFLWIGTLVGLLAGAGRAILHGASPNSRYIVALGSLMAMSVLPLAIMAWISVAERPISNAIVAPLRTPFNNESARNISDIGSDDTRAAIGGHATTSAGSHPLDTAQSLGPQTISTRAKARDKIIEVLVLTVDYLPWLWIVGSPLTLVLVITGAIGAERLRRASRIIVDGPIVDACDRLSQTLNIRTSTAIALCEQIAAPMLIGIIRPIVLLPSVAFTSWTSEELEMVLIHELAHVRRWDNLVNLMQRFVEAALFFHPVVWLLSNWVRREREACCDAVVVGSTNRPHAYAELLVALASQLPRSVLFHPAASNALVSGPLERRIRAVLGIQDDPLLVSSKSIGIVMSGLLLVATLLVLNLPSQGDAGEGQLAENRTFDAQREEPPLENRPLSQTDVRENERTTHKSAPSVHSTSVKNAESTKRPKDDVIENQALQFEGKTFDEWIALSVTELSQPRRIESVRALTAFGANGMGDESTEAILRIVSSLDWRLTEAPSGVLNIVCIQAFAGNSQGGYRIATADWLPILLDKLKESPALGAFAFNVARELIHDESAKMQIFLAISESTDKELERAGLICLKQQDQRLEHEDYVARIRKELNESNDSSQLVRRIDDLLYAPSTRERHGGGMGMVGQEINWQLRMVPELPVLLLSPDDGVSRKARFAISFASPEDARATVNSLQALLLDGQQNPARLNALRALVALGNHAGPLKEMLETIADTKDDPGRFAAELALIQMGARVPTVRDGEKTTDELHNGVSDEARKIFPEDSEMKLQQYRDKHQQ